MGTPQTTVQGYRKMWLPNRWRGWGVWAIPILDPWRGLGASQRPQGSLQEFNREQGSGSFSEGIQAHHATMAPTREAIVSGVRLQERDTGVRGTRVTTPVTPSPLQPQDLAIVNRHGLISSLLTRSGSWGWMLAWWAASTGTMCSSWRNHPPDPPLPTPMLNGPPSGMGVLGGCTWGRSYLPTFPGWLW